VTRDDTPTAPDAAASAFSIVGGDPTDAEVAAVTAVLGAALEEIAAGRELETGRGTTAWQRSQRPIRRPIVRSHDAWRGFSG
jgi:hypothetical protein